jgi:hypothetical protein
MDRKERVRQQAEHLIVKCHIMTETAKAIKVHLPESERDVWIPLSQVSYIKRNNGDDELHVTKWFCKREDINAV